MSIDRDADGFSLRLDDSIWQHHESMRFCPRDKCVDQASRCCNCHVPRLTTGLRAKNIEMVRAGKRDASDQGSSMTQAEANRRGWLDR